MAFRLRRDEASMLDLLAYWEIKDGVVVLDSGVMETALELSLPSTLLSPVSSLETLHTAITGLLRHCVPQKERLRLLIEVSPMRRDRLDHYQAQLISKHPSAQVLSQGKTAFLESARRQGKLVEYRAFLTCTLTPSTKRRRKQAFSPEEFQQRYTRALEIRQSLIQALDKAGLRPIPLFDQALFELIWRYFNPATGLQCPPQYQAQTFHYPKTVLSKFPQLAEPSLRNQLVSSDLARRWDHLWFSGHFAQLVSMSNLPVAYTQAGMIGHLLKVPRLFWLIIDYVHDPHGPALRSLMTQARRLYSATGDTGGLTDYADPNVRVGFKEVDDALSHVSESGTHVYRVGVSMLLLEPEQDRLKKGLDEARDAFIQLPGVQPIVETAGLLTQFKALAPCSGLCNERMFLTLQENAADFFPLDAPWQGSSQPLSLVWNRWDSLSALDPFDPKSSNWNGMVIGGSGSGKTFLMQTLLGDLLRQDVEVMIVDRGYGYQHLVELFDGELIPIEPGGKVSINPFDLPEGELKPDDQKKGFLMALLSAMLPSETPFNKSLENALLSSAIHQLYDGANGNLITLSDLARLLTSLNQIGERQATKTEQELAKSLALRLEPWTGESAFASFIDRPTTIKTEASVIYFETSGLERHAELRSVALLLLTELIWQRISKDLSRKKIVVLDEVWSLLKHPQAASFIVELYRRFRRYNAAVYAVTQSLQDFQTEEARGILQNTTYHYLLRLATEDELIQNLLKLSDRAMDIFRNLSSKKGSYSEAMTWIRQEDGLQGGVLVLRPSPIEYWAYTTHAEDMVLREAVIKKHGELLPALEELAQAFPEGVRGATYDR
ncbi:MAG: ATP-binding protein [Trueperaceae bacterium]|nr:ATP-binding protein [Trueperaceae bacterium]